MRRILRDFFGYEVQFVMNITDVDDKVSQLGPSVVSRADQLTHGRNSGRARLPDYPARTSISPTRKVHCRRQLSSHAALASARRRSQISLGGLLVQEPRYLARQQSYIVIVSVRELVCRLSPGSNRMVCPP